MLGQAPTAVPARQASERVRATAWEERILGFGIVKGCRCGCREYGVLRVIREVPL